MNRRSPDFRLRESGSLIRGHSVIALSRVVSGALLLQRIDCEVRSFSSSWACYLVFKDRAACTTCDLCATVPTFGCGLESTAGPHSLFEAAFSVKRLAALGFQPPASASGLSSERRRLLLLRRPPCQPAVSGLDSFVVRRTALLLRSRGRGFYHRRVLSQPPSSTLYFRCQPAVGFPSEGRGFYFAAGFCVNNPCSELHPGDHRATPRSESLMAQGIGARNLFARHCASRPTAPGVRVSGVTALPHPSIPTFVQRPDSEGGTPGRSSFSFERSTRPRRHRSATTTERSSW